MSKKKIVSGMRPTGFLHLGNLHGALQNWIELQNDGQYDCFFFVADWHALTSEFVDTSLMADRTFAMVVDWLATGLDPAKSTFFVQSSIKEHAELFLLLSMITPVSWLERNPAYKEMRAELTQKDLSNIGFLAYPVLMAVDIIMYKAYGVPVGVDQLPHIELTREIARRFNFLYGEAIFPEPVPLLTSVPKLLGTDGRKMSKSYDNAIFISDRGDELYRKITTMFTDPQRQRRKDPGRPEVCNVFAFHQIYTDAEKVKEIDAGCRNASIGCTDCKKWLAERIAQDMQPIHDRQDYYREHPDEVRDIMTDGNRRASEVARATMDEVRSAVKISYGL